MRPSLLVGEPWLDIDTGICYIGTPDGTAIIGSGEVLNVRKFGAKGDGISDDSPSFQAAIDFAAEGLLKTVFVPAGVYNVKNVKLRPRCSLIGDGRESVLRMVPGVYNPTYVKTCDCVLYYDEGNSEFTGEGVVANLVIDGNKGSGESNARLFQAIVYDYGDAHKHRGIVGIRLLGAWRFQLLNVFIHNVPGIGIFLDEAGDGGSGRWSQVCIMRDLWIQSCETNGIFFDGGAVDASLENIEVGLNNFHGVQIKGGGAHRISGLASFWNGNGVGQSTRSAHGLFVHGVAKELQIVHSRFERNSGNGISLENAEDILFAGIRCYLNSTYDEYSADHAYPAYNYGAEIFSGIRLGGACKKILIDGVSGDHEKGTGWPINGCQKYGLEEAEGGYIEHCEYRLFFPKNGWGNTSPNLIGILK